MNQEMTSPRGLHDEVKMRTAYVPSADTLFEVSLYLPFYAAQAWQYSVDDMAKYLTQHICADIGLGPHGTALLATARLNRLLYVTRATISGLFTRSDITLLLNCFMNEVFLPDQMCDLTPFVLDDEDAYICDSDFPEDASLIEKLRDLSAVQHAALADALEQAFYRGKHDGLSAVEVFTDLGIKLLDE